jgi:hypothetical protein
MVKGFFDSFNCPGRKAGYLGWVAPVPGKLTSVFIIIALLTEAAKKKRLVKGVLIGASVQGRRFGALGCAAPVPRAKVKIESAAVRKILFRSCRRSSCPGAQGRSREAPARFI